MQIHANVRKYAFILFNITDFFFQYDSLSYLFMHKYIIEIIKMINDIFFIILII